jgi:hypothetical protein
MAKNLSAPGADRRKHPRFGCAGSVRIACLPATGGSTPGKIVDLSLGGCRIQTSSVLMPGTPAELLLLVKGVTIRAVSRVQAGSRGGVVGVEFELISAMGKDVLSDLLAELSQQIAGASPQRAPLDQPAASLTLSERKILLGVQVVAKPLPGRADNKPVVSKLFAAPSNSLKAESIVLDVVEIDLYI